MNALTVAYKGGIQFLVSSGKHSLTIDLAPEKGGSDEGMSPPEVFIASLASCIGVYVVRYAQNAKLDTRDLAIRCGWQISDDKKRISSIQVRISLPHADVGKREGALLEAARHCLIHHTITEH